MLKENILFPIMRRTINKFDSLSFSSDQVDLISGKLVKNLTCFNTFQPFPNRICSIKWIPKRPSSLLIGGKHGELCLIPDVNKYTISGNDEKNLVHISTGIGPGGEIREIIPDTTDISMFYSLNVSGELVKVDISSLETVVLQPQGDFNIWFAGLNVHHDSRTILMGDNKGCVHLLPDTSRAGSGRRSTVKCHKPGKINHIEFHPRDPNMFATAASSDCSVKLWDIRMFKDMEEIAELPHNRGVASCYFNRTGHKILTTDQGDQLKIFSCGSWNQIATITHHHRQFQYITPIRAEWHPLADIIVVGRYPLNNKEQKTIDFFDGRDGGEILSLNTPNNKISSLNRFNYTGDVLASMYQSEITIWKLKTSTEEKGPSSKAVRSNRKRPSDETQKSDSSSTSSDDSGSDYDDPKGKKTMKRSQTKKKKAAPKVKKTPAKKKLPPRNTKKKG